jgi:hypothetical protein
MLDKPETSRYAAAMEPADVLIVLGSPPIVAAYAPGFAVMTLRREGGALVLHAPHGAVLEHAPQAALAVVTAPGEATPDIAAWTARQMLDCPVIAHAEGLPAVLAALAAQRRRLAGDTAQTLLQLAELRMQYSALAASHDAVLALLRTQGLALPVLAVDHPPDPTERRLLRAARALVQPIDADIRTVCAIGLHLAEPAELRCTLELFAPDHDGVAVIWEVAEALPAGWFTHCFAARADVPAGGTALRLRWEAGCPPLSLARPTLRADRAARIDGVAGDRPLALRAFAGVPGGPAAATRAMWPARPAGGGALGRIDVRFDATLRLHDLRGLHANVHFPPVAVLDAEHQIQVHPLEALPTIAALPALCPPGTQEVRARVTTANPAAGPIEYGLLIAPPGETDAAALAALVAWRRIVPGTEALLTLELPAPLAAPGDLLLLTRLPPGASSAACWARFTAISLHGRFDGF